MAQSDNTTSIAAVDDLRPRKKAVLHREPSDAEPMSVAAAGERFAGEWVLMQVVSYDEYHNPATGRIIAHSPSNRTVCRLLDIALTPCTESTEPYYLFSAFKPLPGKNEFRAALAAAEEEADERGWHSLRRYGR